jgi:DNA-binding NtrC family response regulator
MSTTRPSASTGLERTARKPKHILWVYPTTMVMPLAGRLVVGRDRPSDVVLAGEEISRRHAEFRLDGPLIVIRDLDSSNGVFVNGVRQKDAPLEAGDVVRCGEWIGLVSVPADPPFGPVATGWYGGATLFAATESARRLDADLPVIVQGETGSGKEGIARAVHAWSGREGPFVALNCATLPANVAEAELFGYRKGAFTGADRPSHGLFRAAAGGTLFLDEILDLPPPIQPKLLRALEQREVLPLGETAPVIVDVRVVAATQEPLDAAVAAGRFRADLYARLDGLTVILPPLRERREDIVPLFLEFLRQHAGQPPVLEPKLLEALCLYDWPLNVRELSLLARRMLGVHGSEGVLRKAHLPERIVRRRETRAGGESAPLPLSPGKKVRRKTDDEAEFAALVSALRSHRGSVGRAAEAIGISRARAYRVLEAHPDYARDAEGDE